MPRRERLIRLAAAFPLYVPELYATEIDGETGLVVVGAPLDPRVPARPKRAMVADINRFPFPDDSPLPYAEAIFDRMAVEVARGCTEGCRFCQAGMIYRPVRERDPVAVLDALLGGVKKGGYDETALTSLSTADYSCVTPLVKAAMARLAPERVSLSVSSLRAYGLNEDLLGEMASVRAGGLTFAPEAGTQRMRDVVAKNVTEEDIIESAHRVFGRGFSRMKLYFMIGLPTETDEDVLGIVETTARVQEIGRRYQRGAQVTASVSTHVPKPHTPFQWAAMDGEQEIARKQELLATRARALRVTLKMHENQASHIEGIFSRGDRLRRRRAGGGVPARLPLRQLGRRAARRAVGSRHRRDGGAHGRRHRPLHGHVAGDRRGCPGVTSTSASRTISSRRSTGRRSRIGCRPRAASRSRSCCTRAASRPPRRGAADKLICYDCGVACDLGAMKQERLFYLRRMNAWLPTDNKPRGARAGGRGERRPSPHDAAAEARAAGDAPPLPAALHEAGARRVPRPPGSGAPPAAHLPARRVLAVSTRRGFTRSPSCRSDPRWGSASRRWASWSTSRWSMTWRPTSCCAGWRGSRSTASSSSRRRGSGRRIGRSAA